MKTILQALLRAPLNGLEDACVAGQLDDLPLEGGEERGAGGEAGRDPLPPRQDGEELQLEEVERAHRHALLLLLGRPRRPLPALPVQPAVPDLVEELVEQPEGLLANVEHERDAALQWGRGRSRRPSEGLKGNKVS